MKQSRMVKIYLASINELKEESNFLKKLDLVDENRIKKIETCKNQVDKVRSLGAGLLLRFALEQEGIHRFEVQTSPLGKPFLEEKIGLHFSLSHSGEYVLCGISDSNVGVDIQMIKEKIKYRKIAQRFFTESEVEYIGKDNRSDYSIQRFTDIWAIKESYLKYCGQGLRRSLDTFEIVIAEEFIKDNLDKGKTDFWVGRKDNYSISICKATMVEKYKICIQETDFS